METVRHPQPWTAPGAKYFSLCQLLAGSLSKGNFEDLDPGDTEQVLTQICRVFRIEFSLEPRMPSHLKGNMGDRYWSENADAYVPHPAFEDFSWPRSGMWVITSPSHCYCLCHSDRIASSWGNQREAAFLLQPLVRLDPWNRFIASPYALFSRLFFDLKWDQEVPVE